MPFHWNARTPKDSHSELSIWGRSFQLLSYREKRGTQADLAHSCRMRVCRRILPRQTSSMKENQRARSPLHQVSPIRPTTASQTVAQFARYGADIQHWRTIDARHDRARLHRGGTRAESRSPSSPATLPANAATPRIARRCQRSARAGLLDSLAWQSAP
jgi:hypothetical protein